MEKENKFKEGLKFDASKRKIEELSSDEAWHYNKNFSGFTQAPNDGTINENEIVNLDEFYKRQRLDEINNKYDKMIEEDRIEEEARREAEKREAAENRKRQQEYRRKLKKRNTRLKGVFITAGALGLSTLFAMGVTNGVKNIIDKPINFRQAMQIGMNPQTDLGISQKSEEELNSTNIRLEDTSNFKESDAYYTLTMINDTFEDVIIDKIVSATNTNGKVKLGTKFEEGGTVEYVTIEEGNTSNMYLKDSIVNSIVHEKTIPESMAKAIGNYKDTQSYIIQIQEYGDKVPLPDTIKKCEDLNDKLNEFAAVKISYDDKNKKFEEHIIRESELDSIAKGNSLQNPNQSVQDSSKNSNNEKIQNAVINNGKNENDIQNVNYEQNDEYEEDYER